MADTVFVNLVTLSDADWFNDLNRLHYTIFSDPANVGAVVATFAATQVQQEAGTNNLTAVTPGRQHFHPSALKGWCISDSTGATPGSYNVNNVVDGGTGLWDVVWGNDLDSADSYAAVVSVRSDANYVARMGNTGYLATSTRVLVVDLAGTSVDPNYFTIHVAGELA